MTTNSIRKRRVAIAYLVICLIWGSTWSAIRLLVRDVPPLRAAAVRFALAAAILLVVAFARGISPVSLRRRQWLALGTLGVTMMGVPYGLLFWAEYRISSSLTAVLFSSLPLFVALFTSLTSQTSVPRRAVFAMLIAVGAISTLFYSQLSSSLYFLLGGLAVLVAVVLSAWSAVFAKRELADVNPILGTGVQFVVSAAALFLGSMLLEQKRPSDWNATSLAALGFLTLFGSVIAFSLYYWLLGHMHAYQLSTTNLVVPIVAMAEGALLLQERLPLLMVTAAALVLVSVAVVLRAESEDEQALSLEIS